MSYEKVNSRERTKLLFKIIIIVILIVIVLTFTTEIEFITSPITTNNNNVETTNTTTSTIKPILSSSDEKFLTYLPRYDFHSQRVAFINAIMLSYMTKRTLIIPPILINYFPRTYTIDSLYNDLNNIIKIKKYREEHCYNEEENEEFEISNYCDFIYSEYDDFTMINWEQLFDLNELRKHVKMINRGFDFSLDNLKNNFNIGENDTYLFNEGKPSFKIFDNKDSIKKNFKEKFFIKDLMKIEEKLLHFSSLSESDRIILENQDNKKFQQLIYKKLIINNPDILNISEKITKELGGKKNYIGLHIRVRGTFFRFHDTENMNLIYNNLMNYLLKSDLLRNSKKVFNYNLEECIKNNIPIIYISTDSFEPRSKFIKYYETIPCIFTLFDFSKELEYFSKIPSEYDEEVDLTNFYVPIIDLLITAHGKTFIGTPKSPFSQFASEVNNVSNGKNAI